MKCSKCGIAKPPEDFFKYKKSLTGRYSYCKSCHVQQHKEWIRNNRGREAANVRALKLRRKFKVMSHYSRGVPRCACCGESELAFLSIDHINGGGAKDKREGVALWTSLINSGFPSGFQVLCMNCNWAKYANGQCPHQWPRTGVL